MHNININLFRVSCNEPLATETATQDDVIIDQVIKNG